MKLRDLPRSEHIPVRFWAKCQKGDDCWIWTGTCQRNPRHMGYGLFSVGSPPHRKAFRAHRIAYLLEHGEIPDGLCVCHTCDNPKCVRPDHLFLGTVAENFEDMVQKGRHRNTPAPGETNPKAKLTWEKVREIRQRHASGESQTALGKAFRVSQVQISHIVLGKHWKDAVDVTQEEF